MKKVIVLLSLCVLFSFKSYSQFAFGVAPGLSTNSAYFGLKAGKVVPYIGFQYANIKVNMVESGEEFDYDVMDMVSYSYDSKLSGNLYLPNLGIKFYAVEKNKLKAYFNVSLAKPFIRGKLENDGETSDEFNDELKKIKLFAGEFGFGTEYFFDNNFSIGGEFGIRYLFGKYTNSYEDEEYNPNTSNYETVEIENTTKVGLSPTYSKISLNFYFGGE